MVTFDVFRNEVLSAMNSKPKKWRDGQFVFNYIDEKYGVARSVQFIDFKIQAPDHPASLSSDEQLYLKCMILRIK